MVFELGGHGRHAVAYCWSANGLYVPREQLTTRPAVHHCPLGHEKGTSISMEATTIG